MLETVSRQTDVDRLSISYMLQIRFYLVQTVSTRTPKLPQVISAGAKLVLGPGGLTLARPFSCTVEQPLYPESDHCTTRRVRYVSRISWLYLVRYARKRAHQIGYSRLACKSSS
jgi:hypothetical protein